MRKSFYFLIVFFTLAGAVFAAEPNKAVKPIGRSVSWTTPDGVRLKGLYHPRRGPGHLTWVLLHGLGSNKQEWLGFVEQLVKQGDGFLTYDARGHGVSTQLANGAKISYRSFDTVGPDSPWDHMTGDLESAIAYLKGRYPLNGHGIAVGGASLGANVALVYAASHPEVPALLLLSPGLQYAGVATEKAMDRFGDRPVLMAASPTDGYAYASVRELSKKCSEGACTLLDGEGAAHGVAMFNEPFSQKVLAWMKTCERPAPAKGSK